jgi:hypothetical protein
MGSKENCVYLSGRGGKIPIVEALCPTNHVPFIYWPRPQCNTINPSIINQFYYSTGMFKLLNYWVHGLLGHLCILLLAAVDLSDVSSFRIFDAGLQIIQINLSHSVLRRNQMHLMCGRIKFIHIWQTIQVYIRHNIITKEGIKVLYYMTESLNLKQSINILS